MVGASHQGALQGGISSMNNVAAILGPLIATQALAAALASRLRRRRLPFVAGALDGAGRADHRAAFVHMRPAGTGQSQRLVIFRKLRMAFMPPLCLASAQVEVDAPPPRVMLAGEFATLSDLIRGHAESARTSRR